MPAAHAGWELHRALGISLVAADLDSGLTAPSSECPQSNFWHNCIWSPDGSCVAGYRDDQSLRVHTLPSATAEAVLYAHRRWVCDGVLPSRSSIQVLPELGRISAGEPVYAWAWYPRFVAADLNTHFLVSSCRGQPVHLWNAFTGQLWCTYRMYDYADEVASAQCLCFHPDGSRCVMAHATSLQYIFLAAVVFARDGPIPHACRLFAGRRNKVVAWHTNRPGREAEILTKDAFSGHLKGIASTLETNADASLLAVGTYGQMVGLVDLSSHTLVMALSGHQGGVTHAKFSMCGNYIYTGARQDASIVCWDIRRTGDVLYSMKTWTSDTNQRLAFDIDAAGQYLLHGGLHGVISVFDLLLGDLKCECQAASDTITGVSIHPHLPMLATSSGQRRFWDTDMCDWHGFSAVQNDALQSNQLAVWHFNAT